jgi:hypothetical protein
MAPFIGIIIIIILIAIWYFMDDKISQKDLDRKMLNGWWVGSQEFCKESGLDYMFLQLDIQKDITGYIIAGDSEGMVYNNPIKILLKFIKSADFKGNYNFTAVGESPFPENSVLILDRTNCSLSIFKDDVLYGFFKK